MSIVSCSPKEITVPGSWYSSVKYMNVPKMPAGDSNLHIYLLHIWVREVQHSNNTVARDTYGLILIKPKRQMWIACTRLLNKIHSTQCKAAFVVNWMKKKNTQKKIKLLAEQCAPQTLWRFVFIYCVTFCHICHGLCHDDLLLSVCGTIRNQTVWSH